MTMLERTYQQHLALLGSKFNSQDVEGVYETQVPLLFRALINLGVRVSVKKNIGARLEDGFALGDLQHIPLNPSSPAYLGKRNLNYLTLLHAQSGSRHLYAIFSNASTKATIIFSDPGTNYDQVPRNLNRLYSERYEKCEKQREAEPSDVPYAFDYPDGRLIFLIFR